MQKLLTRELSEKIFTNQTKQVFIPITQAFQLHVKPRRWSGWAWNFSGPGTKREEILISICRRCRRAKQRMTSRRMVSAKGGKKSQSYRPSPACTLTCSGSCWCAHKRARERRSWRGERLKENECLKAAAWSKIELLQASIRLTCRISSSSWSVEVRMSRLLSAPVSYSSRKRPRGLSAMCKNFHTANCRRWLDWPERKSTADETWTKLQRSSWNVQSCKWVNLQL